MKKLIYVVMIVAVVAFAGCAFAAGNVSGKYVPLKLGVTEIAIPPNTSLSSADSISAATATVDAAYIDGTILAGIQVDIVHEGGLSSDLTLFFNPNTLAAVVTGAAIENSDKSGFTPYDVTNKANYVVIRGISYDAHFSAAKVYLTNTAAKPDGGSSSGGCNAGFAALLLLAATPLCFFRKK